MMINFRKIYLIALLPFVICFSTNYTIAQTCDCTEYLYLNEPGGSATGPKIRKFEVNENYNPATDPASAVFGQEINAPWFDNTAANESLINPHGLAIDLNGNIYVGEDNTQGDGVIRKIECDGTVIPATQFSINDQGYNFASQGNSLYVVTQDFDDNSPNYINSYDLCTGAPTGFYCLSGIEASRSDWGLHIDDNGILYSTNDFRPEGSADDVPDNLFIINTNTVPLSAPGDANPTCVSPFISQGAASPSIGSNAFARDQIFGVTTDANGNIYIVERTRTGEPDFPAGGLDGSARILKYDSNGVLVAVTPYDINNGDGGYF